MLLGLTGVGFHVIPTGFIPAQDKGYLIVAIQLPDGASLERTDAVVRRASRDHPRHARASATRSPSPASRAPRAPTPPTPAPSSSARSRSRSASTHGPTRRRAARARCSSASARSRQPTSSSSRRRRCRASAPPAASSCWCRTAPAAGCRRCRQATDELVDAARRDPALQGVFTTFRATTPQLYADIDRVKAKKLNVPLGNIFDTLQVYLGSVVRQRLQPLRPHLPGAHAGRGRVPRRAGRHRAPEDAQRRAAAWCRSAPCSTSQWRSGPDRVVRYNMFPSAEVQGDAAPGGSLGTAIAAMEQLAATVLPPGFAHRVDRPRLPGAARRQHRAAHLPALRAVRLPRALGRVRELVAAARHHPDRADVPALRAARRLAARHGQQPDHADRLRRADRPGGEERRADRRVRQAAGGGRARTASPPPSRPAGCACGRS